MYFWIALIAVLLLGKIDCRRVSGFMLPRIRRLFHTD